MNDRDRLEQLPALRDRLDRLPASPQPDRILTAPRPRVVDIEPGMRRTLARPPDDTAPEPPNATLLLPSKLRSPAPVRNQPNATAHPAHAALVPTAAPLLEGVVLSLDDDVVAVESAGRRPVPPWARGLRG